MKKMIVGLSVSLLVGSAAGESFYKEPPIFHITTPSEKGASYSIGRFGPVGMSIELRQPAFQMYIKGIEDGSPAAATGKLEKGQKIESINGQVLKDVDPRVQLGKIITDVEASDGKITLKIEGVGDVLVEIPVLGSYSKSWPLKCAKSDRIVRNLAGYIKENCTFDFVTDNWSSFNGFGALFMLSTGEKKDLDVVRGWMEPIYEQYKDAEYIKLLPWAYGPAALPLAEYYLRTGDKRMLPIIEKVAAQATKTMYSSGWSGRARNAFGYVGQGHMNAAGVHCATFLLLAKECGVDVDEDKMHEALRHFYKYAGKGSLPYGDHFPETWFIDNGKTSALAFTMAAAASLTPDGEKSVYAGARDVSAMRGFYSTCVMLVGHTGGGIGDAWRGPAMGLLYEEEKDLYRSFMNGRQWHLEMSRRFDGSFGMLQESGATRYGATDTWGHMLGMQYTVPRETLRITGAKRSRWSKPYELPVRPWGTAEDDDFCSTKPAAYADGTIPEFPTTLRQGMVMGAQAIVKAETEKGNRDAILLKYAHHPEHEMRREIYGYGGVEEQDHQILPLMNHEDARVRRVGLTGIYHGHKANEALPPERLTDAMMDRVMEMINDPEESWWVVEKALRASSYFPVEKTAPHIDRLLYWLNHNEWWLRYSAIHALAPLAADARYSARALPPLGKVISTNTRSGVFPALGALAAKLKTAEPKVQLAAAQMLSKAYTDFPTELSDVGGTNPNKPVNPLLQYIASHLKNFPGGFDALFEVSKRRFPGQALPYQNYYMWADTSTFSPELQKAVGKAFMDEVIPEYVTRHLGSLRSEVKREKGGNPQSALTGLADLYRKAGQDEYGWHNYGPARNDMEWYYLTGNTKGVRDWQKPEFDPGVAGWKRGKAPFGHIKDEELKRWSCKNPVCRCSDPVNGLWEKGSLLLNGKFNFPSTKEGHSYRLLFGGLSHVGISGRVSASINGRAAGGAGGGVRRGQGGRPQGSLLPRSFDSAFREGDVTIAVSAQPRKQKRNRVAGNFISVWLEEMKNPPFSEEQAWKGLRTIGMQSSEWQKDQQTDAPEVLSNEGLFHFDGKFVPNVDVMGTWGPIGKVALVSAFKPGEETDPAKPRYKSITFKDKGFTDMTTHYWSGDTLMHNVGGKIPMALKIRTKTIDGDEYLFIETGGFTFYVADDRQHYKQPRTWSSPWYVLKKAKARE